jgi:hypothetical protein
MLMHVNLSSPAMVAGLGVAHGHKILTLTPAEAFPRGAGTAAELSERVRTVTTHLAHTPAAEDSFAAKVTKAIAVRLPTARTVKQAKEQAERERCRYRGYKRQRSKSE